MSNPDVSASPPHALFVGRSTLDAVYRLDALPTEDTKIFARDFLAAPGGPACNAALTFARLGGQATLLSAVGEGTVAESLRQALQASGIRLIDLADGTRYQTPLTTVLVNTAASTRTIVNPPPSAVELPVLSGEWNIEWGPLPTIVLSDGFHLRESLPLLKTLRDRGAHICLDGGSWKPGTDELAELLSIAVCSERFAPLGQSPCTETTFTWFGTRGVSRIAITRGSKPILGIEQDRRFEIDIRPIEAVDTLGAGDVLHGALCYYLATGHSFEPALREAAAVATEACLRLGLGCRTTGLA